MAKIKLTKSAILKVLEKHKPTSFSGLYRALGGTANIASSTIKTIRQVVPDIEKRLHANKGKGPTVRTSGKSKGRKRWKRSKFNPYRESSNYALCFDVLAAHPSGLSREKLVNLYAIASGKDEKTTARYDVAVVTSPTNASPTSERHRSARESYGIRKEGSHIQVILPK